MGKRAKEKWQRRQEEGTVQVAHPRELSAIEKVCFYIIEWGTYLALFTPLIVGGNYFFPYVAPKTIFFRIIVDVIFAAYVLLATLNPRYRPRINILNITLTIFLGILILTSLTGIDFARSFWSVFERMTGLLTIIHLYVFFLVLASCFQERKYWERILTVSMLVGVILSIYAFSAKASIARGGGTVGNVSFMSSYLLFDIFFGISLFFSKNWRWKIFYGALLVPLTWLLLFPPQEPSRGAIGAFLGGLFVLFFSYLLFYLFSSPKKILKGLAVLLIILVIAGAAGFIQTDLFKKEMASIKQSTSWQAREVVWKMGFDTWKERFWLGWGLENFNVPFAKYYNPTLPVSGDIWYDRVHNVFIDTPVASGFLGLLSYLAIFFFSIFYLFKTCFKITRRRNIFLPLAMISLLLAYLAQNIWVFDMISSYVVFFLTLAFISFLTAKRAPSPEKRVLPKNKLIPSLVSSGLLALSVFTVYFGNVLPSRASFYIVQGVTTTPLEKGISFLQKALNVSPIAAGEAPEQLARLMTNHVSDQKTNREVLIQGFEAGAEALKKSIIRSPLDFRAHLILGRHYNDFYRVSRDPGKLVLAEDYFKKAQELSPKNQQVYWSLAETRFSQNRFDEALELMKKAVELEPNFGQAQWYLAMSYKVIGNYKLALEAVDKTEKAGLDWKKEPEKLREVITIYEGMQDDEHLAPLYLLGIGLAPGDARFRAGLAVAYANLGQFDKARQRAKEAIQLDPQFASQMEEFLKSLPK